jgi:hypothetical protein
MTKLKRKIAGMRKPMAIIVLGWTMSFFMQGCSSRIVLGNGQLVGMRDDRPMSSMGPFPPSNEWVVFSVHVKREAIAALRRISSTFHLYVQDCDSHIVLSIEDLYVGGRSLNEVQLMKVKEWREYYRHINDSSSQFYVDRTLIATRHQICVKADGGSMYGWRVYTNELEIPFHLK